MTGPIRVARCSERVGDEARSRGRTALLAAPIVMVGLAAMSVAATTPGAPPAAGSGSAHPHASATPKNGSGAGITLPAQRRVVLEQIELPHHYYYREMFVPQVTSGPSSVDFTPDGGALVYSMQGSLWRQEIDSAVAEQLTDGPGYDHQPDVSPDGRHVAYVSYRGDAIELRLLDLTSLQSKPLISNGAVQVEPRFSPDGRRLAFVSTLHDGRWHIFTAPFQDGEMGPATRVTEDRDSALPRYYYSRFDHYLSPTWSPDGRELIFVSNRGRIWGTGGFWRIAAEPGAEPREIRYEETNWKARPDWSPDGRRVVYSSYLGRQWHQLWLMTAEGGDVLPITYGDFDATAARWSPDGRRIAYVSNEEGNTSLWILELPGGARRQVRIEERRYRNPTGRLRIRLVDAAAADAGGATVASGAATGTGGEAGASGAAADTRGATVASGAATQASVAARVSVTGEDGRSWAPDDAWRHADDSFDRSERPFEYGYFHARGEAEITLPAGGYEVEVVRGLEHRPFRARVAVAAGETAEVGAELERIDNLRAGGWYSGDLHVHMNYGGAYRNDPARLAFQAAAEDLDVVENLIVNKEQRVPDIAWFRPGPDPASTGDVLIVHGQEFHTSLWGHTGLLGLSRNYLLPDYAAYVNTAAASPYPHNAAVADLAHEQGALVGYVHPFDTRPDPADTTAALNYELPVDVALGKIDYLEVMGYSDHLLTSEIWYRLLNCGFRIPAGAGTDAFPNFASLRGPPGLARVFVQSGAALNHRGFLAGLKAGRTFVTNAPLLEFSLAGRAIGEEIRLAPGSHRLTARVDMRSNVPVDHLEIIGNGKVVATIPLRGERMSATDTISIPVTTSGWYVLRAYSDRATMPVLDLYPFGSTSPIYVQIGREPVRSADDAAFFVRWIERIEASTRASTAWNTPGEQASALRALTQAKGVFQDRARP